MGTWTPQDWVLIMTAVGTLIAGVFAATAAFLANLAKIKSENNERKIDENTVLTKYGTAAAHDSAKKAATTAAAAAASAKATEAATEKIAGKLNGELEARMKAIVNDAVAPITASLAEHAASDEKNMLEVKTELQNFASNSKLKEFSDYVHQRNHDLLDALHANGLKMDLVIAKMEAK